MFLSLILMPSKVESVPKCSYFQRLTYKRAYLSNKAMHQGRLFDQNKPQKDFLARFNKGKEKSLILKDPVS